MNRSRCFSWILGLGLLATSACDQAPDVAPGVNDCQTELVALRVEVVSADGARVRGATVTGTNLQTNASITGVTDGLGVTTAINESLAPSTVRVEAIAGSKVSSPVRVEWVCNTCNCAPEPATLQLQLSP